MVAAIFDPITPAELTVSLPRASGIATYPPGSTFGPRRLRDFELVWIIEGGCRYRRDDRFFDAPPGSIVLCQPGGIDSFEWDQVRPTRHAYFYFTIEALPAECDPEQWPVVVATDENDVLIPLFRHVLNWAGHGDDALLRQVVGTMIRAIIVQQRTLATLKPLIVPDPVARADAFIHQSLAAGPASGLTLDSLAAVACVTPEHLCRLFRQTVGRSPMACVRLARLDRAARLLAGSNFSIGQVATMCGFASQFHFSRRFKQAFKVDPTTARLRARAGAEASRLPELHARRSAG